MTLLHAVLLQWEHEFVSVTGDVNAPMSVATFMQHAVRPEQQANNDLLKLYDAGLKAFKEFDKVSVPLAVPPPRNCLMPGQPVSQKRLTKTTTPVACLTLYAAHRLLYRIAQVC